jgi:hypothetical protein
MRISVVQHAETNVLEIVLTLISARRFPRRLDRRQQQCHQYPDDGNHHQQFNQRETM